MKTLVSAAVVAAAFATSLMLGRWLDRRNQRIARARDEPVESWENEGGAVPAREAAPPRD